MHVQTTVEVVEAALVLVKERVVHVVVDSIVANNVWVELESVPGSVVGVGAIAGSVSRRTSIAHMDVLHHAIGSVALIDHVAWKKCAFVQIRSGSRYPNSLLCG